MVEIHRLSWLVISVVTFIMIVTIFSFIKNPSKKLKKGDLLFRANYVRKNLLLTHHRELLERLEIGVIEIIVDQNWMENVSFEDFLEIVDMIAYWNYFLEDDVFVVPSTLEFTKKTKNRKEE